MGHAEAFTSFRTLTDALATFDANGYREIFRADRHDLLASHDGRRFRPTALAVDQSARVEGDSNPDEESLVLALRDPVSDLKGTYTVTFGPNMDPADVELVMLLE